MAPDSSKSPSGIPGAVQFRVCRRCRPDQEAHAAAFAAAGWRVLESGDEDLCEAIANALAGED